MLNDGAFTVKKFLPDGVKNFLPTHVKNSLPRHVKNSLPCGCKVTLPRTRKKRLVSFLMWTEALLQSISKIFTKAVNCLRI